MYNVRPIYEYKAASGVEVISISEENFLKVINKEDEKYMKRFKNVSLKRFREIFRQIKSSKKKKKKIFEPNILENSKKQKIKAKIKQKDEPNEFESDYKEIIKTFNKLVNNENYLLGNISQNESLLSEYKKSFQLEEFIISEINS